MQALETNEGGHLRCGNTLTKLEKMEKFGPNAKVVVVKNKKNIILICF
jgi:hypothetical protein